jgi:hypothetical protein
VSRFPLQARHRLHACLTSSVPVKPKWTEANASKAASPTATGAQNTHKCCRADGPAAAAPRQRAAGGAKGRTHKGGLKNAQRAPGPGANRFQLVCGGLWYSCAAWSLGPGRGAISIGGVNTKARLAGRSGSGKLGRGARRVALVQTRRGAWHLNWGCGHTRTVGGAPGGGGGAPRPPAGGGGGGGGGAPPEQVCGYIRWRRWWRSQRRVSLGAVCLNRGQARRAAKQGAAQQRGAFAGAGGRQELGYPQAGEGHRAARSAAGAVGSAAQGSEVGNVFWGVSSS